jgi:hypothetical protein
VFVVPDHLRVEALLEQVADAIVPFVEPLRVDAVEAVHATRDVLQRGFDDEVKVVVEQAVGLNAPTEARGRGREEAQPACAIRIVGDDRHPRDAAHSEVVATGGRENTAWQASHERNRRAGATPRGPVRRAFYRHVTGTVPKTRSVRPTPFGPVTAALPGHSPSQ